MKRRPAVPLLPLSLLLAWLLLTGNSRPGIADPDTHPCIRHNDPQCHDTAWLAALQGVFEQVQKRSRQGLPSADDYSVAGETLAAKANASLCTQRLHRQRGIGQQVINGNGLTSDFLPARKEQHILDQSLETLQLFRRLTREACAGIIGEVGLGEIGAVEKG